MEWADAERFADLVRRAREARGLSIRAAASAGGLSDTTWRRLEDPEQLRRYSPRPGTLRALATALGVKLDQVFHWAGRSFEGIDPPQSLEAALRELDRRQQVPAALSGAWPELTEAEQQQVIGYVQALRDQRRRVEREG